MPESETAYLFIEGHILPERYQHRTVNVLYLLSLQALPSISHATDSSTVAKWKI